MSDLSTDIKPSIYIACLASYNNGYLHGKWIAIESYDQVMNEVDEILKSSPIPNAEEYAIHDYEYLGDNVDEYDGIQSVCDKADFIKEHGALALGLLKHFCGNLEDCKRAMENYIDVFDSELDFAYHLADELYDIDTMMGELRHYFDYESYAKSLFLDGYYSVGVDYKYHVFSEREQNDYRRKKRF